MSHEDYLFFFLSNFSFLCIFLMTHESILYNLLFFIKHLTSFWPVWVLCFYGWCPLWVIYHAATHSSTDSLSSAPHLFGDPSRAYQSVIRQWQPIIHIYSRFNITSTLLCMSLDCGRKWGEHATLNRKGPASCRPSCCEAHQCGAHQI